MSDAAPIPPPPASPGKASGGKFPWIIGALIACFILALLAEAVMQARGGALLREKPAPDFAMEKFGGGTVRLSELRGKVVLLDFWATWCGPCREELPYLAQIAKDYESKGVTLVAASRDDPSEAKVMVGYFVSTVLPPLKDHTITFASDYVAAQYKVEALPTLYFINREGMIVDSARGQLSERQIRQRVEKALGN